MSTVLFSRNGSVGIIMTVLILGFLMVISMSGVYLVGAEKQGAVAARNPDRAYAAAESGIFYYLGVISATTTTFLTPQADTLKRIHFLSKNTRNTVNVGGQQVATYTGRAPVLVFTSIATSTWMFASGTPLFTNVDDKASSSLFMIKTFADCTNLPVSLASYVYIKSLGVYREMDNNTPVASYYAQLIARLEVIPGNKQIKIDRIWRMPIEYPYSETASFHANLNMPW